ncbi:MAG: integrase core domain-containing protein [Akkermansia sp.]|nr:integrase core domain-containing protein [Akkermansia sp.]
MHFADCFLINEVDSLESAQRLIVRWLTYYNQERPHARLGNLSPSEYCRQKGYPPCGEFFARFFRSDTARVAPLRVLATLGTQYLRYNNAQKMD